MEENSKEWLEKEASLKERAKLILRESTSLYKLAQLTLHEICSFFDKYPEDVFEQLEWEEKEKYTEQVNGLFKKLATVQERLLKVDADACEIGRELNEFYGYEAWKLTPLDPLCFQLPPMIDEEPREEYEKNEDWWKTSN